MLLDLKRSDTRGNVQANDTRSEPVIGGFETKAAATSAKRNPGTDDRDQIESTDGIRILEPIAPIAPLERQQFERLNVASRLQVLQSYEGAVFGVDKDRGEFTARLFDLTHPAADISEATFLISDISANDVALLRDGALFRWMIGYRKHAYGQMDRVSAIIFRRLPAWYEEDLKAAAEEGERLASAFTVD